MKKVLGTILIVIYAIIAVSVTILLLSYNDYKVSEINGYSFCIMGDESLEPEYKRGNLLIAKKTNKNKVEVGDNILVYKTISTNEFEIVNRKVEEIMTEGNHVIYLVNNEEQYDSEYLIAKSQDIKQVEHLGTILGILESRWGYLFFVVIISLVLLLQEIFELVMEVKYGNREEEKEDNKEKTVEVEKVEEKEEKEEKDSKKETKKEIVIEVENKKEEEKQEEKTEE